MARRHQRRLTASQPSARIGQSVQEQLLRERSYHSLHRSYVSICRPANMSHSLSTLCSLEHQLVGQSDWLYNSARWQCCQ
jgi:hypothetical protein